MERLIRAIVIASCATAVPARPAAAQSSGNRQQCQACTAAVARLGFRYSTDWGRAGRDSIWAETITVAEVLDRSPAAAAGLRTGDVILRVNDLVATSQLFWSVRRTIQRGDSLRILVRRSDGETVLRMIAGSESTGTSPP